MSKITDFNEMVSFKKYINVYCQVMPRRFNYFKTLIKQKRKIDTLLRKNRRELDAATRNQLQLILREEQKILKKTIKSFKTFDEIKIKITSDKEKKIYQGLSGVTTGAAYYLSEFLTNLITQDKALSSNKNKEEYLREVANEDGLFDRMSTDHFIQNIEAHSKTISGLAKNIILELKSYKVGLIKSDPYDPIVSGSLTVSQHAFECLFFLAVSSALLGLTYAIYPSSENGSDYNASIFKDSVELLKFFGVIVGSIWGLTSAGMSIFNFGKASYGTIASSVRGIIKFIGNTV